MRKSISLSLVFTEHIFYTIIPNTFFYMIFNILQRKIWKFVYINRTIR
nr:MAG TPA: hypothetical protein [Caudoviricetes sp.]